MALLVQKNSFGFVAWCGVIALIFFSSTEGFSNPVNYEDLAIKFIEETQQELLKNSDDMQSSFGLGMAYQVVGDHKAAIKVFRGMLRVDPSLLRPRLELGKSLYLTQQFDEALYHLEQVAAHSLPSDVAASVKNLISEIKTNQPSFIYEVFWVKDTNPNRSTASTTLTMQGLQYALSENSQQQEVQGIRAVLNGHIPLLRKKNWFAKIQTEHTQYDLESLNFSAFQATLGQTHKIKNTLLAMQLGPIVARYGNSPLYNGHILSGTITKPVTKRHLSYLTINRRNLDYEDQYDGYDAISTGYEIGLSYRPDLQKHWNIKLGSVDHLADFDFNTFQEIYLSVSLNLELLSGWRVVGEYAAKNKSFQASDPLFAITRHDQVQEALLTVANTDFSFKGLVPRLIFKKSNGISTIDLHDYTRFGVMLGVGKVF